MRTQHSTPASRGFPLVEILIVVIATGIVAARIVPDFILDGTDPASEPNLLSHLQTIRSQIELYNVQNPETRYDATTPVGPAFWEPLIRGNYLQMAPENPLQGNSTLVGATPAMGTGWVWTPWADMVWLDDLSPVYEFQAVDESGNLYDGDQDGLPD